MKKILILMVACSMFVAQSCKKDDDKGTDVNKVKADLTAGAWIQVGSEEDGVSNWDTDYEDCEKDDITTFFTDGSYQIDEGATKCDPNDPQIVESGTWELTANGEQIVLQGFAFDIVKLTSTDLVMSIELFDTKLVAYFKRK